jgi:hypothetical protein
LVGVKLTVKGSLHKDKSRFCWVSI